MQIETLRIFCDLVELQSFSRAAEKNFLSQSAVSQQLGQLETEFKTQLINRRQRPFVPTEAGKLLYEAAKEIITRFERFKSDLNDSQNKTYERINVGAIFSIGMHSLQPYIKKFMAKYPNVNVAVQFFDAERIYRDILAGRLDIGIVAVPRKDRELEVYSFVEEPLVLVCSPDHELANEKQIDIHRLQMHRFIAFAGDLPTRQWIDDILTRNSVIVRPIMEFDNTETIKRAVEINSGISILPVTTVKTEVAAGTLVSVGFSNEHFLRPTGIIIRAGRAFAESARYLLKLLRNEL